MALTNCRLIGAGGVENSVSVEVTSDTPDILDTNSQFSFFLIPDSGYTLRALDVKVENESVTENDGFTFDSSLDAIETISLRDKHTLAQEDMLLSNPDVYKQVPANSVIVTIDIDDTYSIAVDTGVNIDIDAAAFIIPEEEEVVSTEVVTEIPTELVAKPHFAIFMNKDNPPWSAADFTLTVTPNTVAYPLTWSTNPGYDLTPRDMVMTSFSNAGDCHYPTHMKCWDKYYFDCILQVGKPTAIARLKFERVESDDYDVTFQSPPHLIPVNNGPDGMWDVNSKFELVFYDKSGSDASPTMYEYDLVYTASVNEEIDNAANSTSGTIDLGSHPGSPQESRDSSTKIEIITMDKHEKAIDDVEFEIFDIDLHNDLTHLGKATDTELVDDKFNNLSQTGLYNLPVTTDSNTTSSTEVGTFHQATDDSPNPISVLGTPGGKFTVALLDVADANNDITSDHIKTLDGVAVTGEQTIPDSGVKVLQMHDFDKATTTAVYDLKVTAGANTIVKNTTKKTTGAAVAGGEAVGNNVTNRFTHPKSNTSIKVLVDDTDMSSTFLKQQTVEGSISSWYPGTTTSTTYTLDPADQIASVENGVASSFVEDIEYRSDVTPKQTIYYWRKNATWEEADRAEVQVIFEVEFYKFGTEDVTITLNLADVLDYDAGTEEFSLVGVLGDVATADFYGDGAVLEEGNGWTISPADAGGAEFAIKIIATPPIRIYQ